MKTPGLKRSLLLAMLAALCCSTASAAPAFPNGQVPIAIQAVAANKTLQSRIRSSSHQSSRTLTTARAGGSAVAVSASAGVRTITSTQRQVLNFFSGGVAGTIASCLTNPLEIVKTQLQSSIASKAAHGELAAEAGHPLAIAKTILERDGVRGFFRGLKPTLVGIVPARSAYFFTYQQSKSQLAKWAGPTNTNLAEGSIANAIISGLAAGIAGNTLTNPIWMIKTRMQILADSSAGQRVYKSYTEVISTIAKEEGIGGFYKGIFASYWGCAEGCVQFVLYEKFKTYLLKQQNERRVRQGLAKTDELPHMTYFLAAAVAKGIASITTYPHEVARTRLREQARDGLFKYHGMWQTLGLVAKEEGWKSLYAGMGIHLLKVVPNSAIMFLTYEIVNSWLDEFQVVDDPQPCG